MFPSRDSNSFGTINLAKASWNNLFRNKGFNFSANEGNSFSYITKVINVEAIDMKFNHEGTMHIIWDFHSPIDVQNIWGKFDLYQDDAEYKEIVVTETDWGINILRSGKEILHVDSGTLPNWNSEEIRLLLKKEDGKYRLFCNDIICWEGIFENNPGIVGISLDPHSYLFTDHLVVDGCQMKGFITYGFYQALMNAGNQDCDWDLKKDALFLFGRGAVSKNDSSFAKWNFKGKGFELFSPKGPEYGTINIYLDGKFLKNIALNSTYEMESTRIYKATDLRMGNHALYIESMDGLLPLDSIKIEL